MNMPKPGWRLREEADEDGAESLGYLHELLLLWVAMSSLAVAVPAVTSGRPSSEVPAIEVAAARDTKSADRSRDKPGDDSGRLVVAFEGWHAAARKQSRCPWPRWSSWRARGVVKLILRVDSQAPYSSLRGRSGH